MENALADATLFNIILQNTNFEMYRQVNISPLILGNFILAMSIRCSKKQCNATVHNFGNEPRSSDPF